jgi:hypothetical protein
VQRRKAAAKAQSRRKGAKPPRKKKKQEGELGWETDFSFPFLSSLFPFLLSSLHLGVFAPLRFFLLAFFFFSAATSGARAGIGTFGV